MPAFRLYQALRIASFFRQTPCASNWPGNSIACRTLFPRLSEESREPPTELSYSSPRRVQFQWDFESLNGFEVSPYPGSEAETLFKITGMIAPVAWFRKSLPFFEIPASASGTGTLVGKVPSGARIKQTGAFLNIAVPLYYFIPRQEKCSEIRGLPRIRGHQKTMANGLTERLVFYFSNVTLFVSN